MNYLCKVVGGKHVAVIEDDSGKVIDTSQPQTDKFHAMGLRDQARNEGVSKFTEIGKLAETATAKAAEAAARGQPKPASPAPAAARPAAAEPRSAAAAATTRTPARPTGRMPAPAAKPPAARMERATATTKPGKKK